MSSRRPTRRTVLASLGAALLAGCGSGGPETETPGTPSPTPTPDTPTAPDQVTTDWPMPAFDAGLSNYAVGTSGPTEAVAELWAAETETKLSAPVVADGRVYAGGADGTVRAYDGLSGSELRQQSVGDMAGTPWVVGDRIVVPTAGAVVALDGGSESEEWRVETPSRTAVVATDQGVYWLGDGTEPTVAGLALATGNERWRRTLRPPWASRLFAWDRAVLVASGTDGRIPWKLDPETGSVVGAAPEPGADFPAERFWLDGTVYGVDPFFGQIDGPDWRVGVNALGAGRNEYALSGGDDHVFYLANGGDEPGLYALARADGSVAWSVGMEPSTVRRPVVADGVVLVQAGRDLRAFDPGSGADLWTQSTDETGERVVVVDDLAFTTGDGTVRALRAP